MTTVTLLASLPSEAEVLAAYRAAGGTIGDVATMVVSTILDLDVMPKLTSWAKSVHEHIEGGRIDLAKVRLVIYQTAEQKVGRATNGMEVLHQVRHKRPGCAHLARHLHANQDLIPVAWRKYGTLHFVGTTFSDEDGGLCNLALRWNGDPWLLNGNYLDDGWLCPSVLLEQVEDTEPQPAPATERSEP